MDLDRKQELSWLEGFNAKERLVSEGGPYNGSCRLCGAED